MCSLKLSLLHAFSYVGVYECRGFVHHLVSRIHLLPDLPDGCCVADHHAPFVSLRTVSSWHHTRPWLRDTNFEAGGASVYEVDCPLFGFDSGDAGVNVFRDHVASVH